MLAKNKLSGIETLISQASIDMVISMSIDACDINVSMKNLLQF